jgi:hypothetical protein
LDGTLQTQGINPTLVLTTPGELFFRNLKYDEFDVFEMSMSEFLIAKERCDSTRWKWDALPYSYRRPFSESVFSSIRTPISSTWETSKENGWAIPTTR